MGDEDFYILCARFVPNWDGDMVVWWLFGAGIEDAPEPNCSIYSDAANSMITICWHIGNNEDFETGFLAAWNDERVLMGYADLIVLVIEMYSVLGNLNAVACGLRFQRERVGIQEPNFKL